MSQHDRNMIQRILLDLAGSSNQSLACTQLELYVQDQRVQTLGWAYTQFCVSLDEGVDPRTTPVTGLIENMRKDFDK